MRVAAFFVLALFGAAQSLSFSGDAERDFVGVPNLVTIEDSFGLPDVGVPNQLGDSLAGWDIRNIHYQYDAEADELNVGIDCFVICGDADGDGNPDTPSDELVGIGGTDTADMSLSESLAMSLDFNLDVPLTVLAGGAQSQPFDVIVGVPAGDPSFPDSSEVTIADSRPECTEFDITGCFGIYTYLDFGFVAPAFRFISAIDHPIINQNPSPSENRPDIEFTIQEFSRLRSEQGGVEFDDPSRMEPWTMYSQTFMGSFVDAGIGEDYVPAQGAVAVIEFPCQRFDECDVCLGDGSSCADCLGVPNGNAEYDECGICAGDGSTCADCFGIANGPNRYDECDVCSGDGSSCADCAGVPNGAASYDECDVCDGDSTSCLDCAGTPNGPALYDDCDVCDGDSSTCLDCRGVPNGSAIYDECGVCGGNSNTCLDCNRIPNGPSQYDICDVCNGDGTTCLDCAGVPNGPLEYDLCDVCGGNSNTCLDCAGRTNGAAVYDECDVCDGNNDSCLDCAGVPNGPATYDVCGVCNGDGSTCLDCNGVPDGPAEYDACDICNGNDSVCADCAGIPNGGTTIDVCNICGGDGTTCLDCAGVPFGTDMPDNCGVCGGDNTTCVCLEIHHCPIEEIDHFLLEWSIVALTDKIYHTQDLLVGIKEELCRYNAFEGDLADELADYLDAALDFRDILDNFCYVNLWFHGAIEGDPALLGLAPRRTRSLA